LKTPVKNYLSITKTEWNGMVVLVVLIAAVLAAPHIGQLFYKDTSINFKKFEAAAAQLRQAGGEAYIQDDEAPDSKHDSAVVHPTLFAFNPNNLPVKQWQKLGLTMRQIKGIKNYEAKGGRFYNKADVKKMYTLTTADYNRLEPYIAIPEKDERGSELPFITVELNTADSAKLTLLKGIGPGFARRIIGYRTRLGGFCRKQQLKEIFGFDDSKYHDVQGQVTVNARKVHKIDINHAVFSDLKNFPYLSYKQVNAIIEYRKQHGNYEALDEMRNIAIMDDEILRKIAPYLVFK
jgi:competence protein ComEA